MQMGGWSYEYQLLKQVCKATHEIAGFVVASTAARWLIPATVS